MAISQRTQEQISKLSLKRKGSTGISLTKVPTLEGVGNLIISAGGSGADLLLEAKGLISQCCCDGTSGKVLKRQKPSRVRYLAFDTDSNATPKKKSSDNTGSIGFDKNEDELVILEDSGLKPLLAPKARAAQKIQHPEIFDWIDTDIVIPSGGNGAGGVRQAGRAMLFLNIDKIINSIDKALDKLAKGNNLTSINIYLLSGISGGTGSGIFLDLAFLLRQRAERRFGVSAGNAKQFPITIYGYLLGPDVNLLNAQGDQAAEKNIKINGGAALQELDHYSKNMKEFRYVCRYSPSCTIDTTTAPFNHIHLICNNGGGGNIPADAYQHCKDIVAEAILNFVADAQSTEDAKADFSLVSYYDNIANHNNLLTSEYPERDHPYLANGVSSWSIPSDQILKYIITQMFKSVDNLFSNAPNDADVQYIYDMLSCGSAQRIGDMMQGWVPPLPYTYNYDQLFRQHFNLQLEVEPVIREWKQAIRDRYFGMADQFKKAMEDYFRREFVDIEKGPVWCNRAMTNSQGDCAALNTRIFDEAKATESDRTGWITESEKLISEINSILNYPEPTILTGGNNKKKEYTRTLINRWNEWAQLQVEIYAAELLIYGCEEEDKNSFYADAMASVTELNHRMFETTVDILDSLRNVVTRNDTEIQVVAQRENQHQFTWSAQSIPRLDLELSKLIHAAGVTDDMIAKDFLKELLDAAGVWTDQHADVSLFIEDYLENHAKNVLDTTLEGLLLSTFKAQSLSDAVETELLPMLVREAVPMFIGNAEYKSIYYLISVPAHCSNILAGAMAFKNAFPDAGAVTVATSALTNRISVISTAHGISMFDYSMYPECESILDTATPVQSHGLYLYQATEGDMVSRNWKENPLPNPIPRRYHLTKGIAYPANLRKTEEDRIRRFREVAKAGYPCLKMTQNEVHGDYTCVIYRSKRLMDTDFEDVTKDSALKDIRGNWDVSKLEEAIAMLNNWLTEGLPKLTETHAPTYTVIENVSTVFTDEQNRRIQQVAANVRDDVTLEEVWNTTDHFYLKAYEYYRTLEDEVKKYDTVRARKLELEAILKEEKDMPARCENVIKMIAAKELVYNMDVEPRWITFDDRRRSVPLVSFSFDEEPISELKAYNALEERRLSDNVHQRAWYDNLLDKTKKNFDDQRDMAIRKKDAVTIEDLKKRVEAIHKQAENNMFDIGERLAFSSGISKVYTSENKKFYDIFVEVAQELIRNLDRRIKIIERDNPQPQPKPQAKPEPQPQPPVEGTWTCPTCKREWDSEFKVCPIDQTPKPQPQPAVKTKWICPTCGREWDSEFRVCPIDQTPQPPQGGVKTTWTCPKCGREWENEFMVCPICNIPKC